MTTKVNLGTAANSGNGDPLRTAFGRVNDAIDLLDALAVDVAELQADPLALPATYVGVWTTATLYPFKSVVTVSDVAYISTVVPSHTSGATFAGDLAAGKWQVHQGLTEEDRPQFETYAALRISTADAPALDAIGQGIAHKFLYSASSTAGAVFTGSISGTTLTVSAVASGTLTRGYAISRSDTGETVAHLAMSGGTGAGGTGTYTLSKSTTLSSQTFLCDTGGTFVVRADGRRMHSANELISSRQCGAIGDGVVRADTDRAGVQAAITAAHASAATALLARGADRLDAGETVHLPQSNSHITGDGSGTNIYGNDLPVLTASDASYVLSSIKNLNLRGGTHGLYAGTAGEIASLNISDVNVVDHSVRGIWFEGGLTSSKFDRLSINGSNSTGAGIECGGGINNNNAITDSDFTNIPGPVIRSAGLTQGWQIRNLRIEGDGQAGVAQHNLDSPLGYHILGGWSETSHEFLLATNGGDDDGVLIEGLVSIGSQYTGSGGLTGSKFSIVGDKRVVFGTNWWSQATTAPNRCLITGANKNLRTDHAIVHARALAASEFAVSKKRSFASSGDQTFTFLTATRPSAANVGGNQQVISGTLRVNWSGYDGGGVGRWGIWKVEFGIHALGNAIDDPNSYITVTLVQGNLGSITFAVEKVSAPTSTVASLRMIFANVNVGLDNFVHWSGDILNTSLVEADRFAVVLY